MPKLGVAALLIIFDCGKEQAKRLYHSAILHECRDTAHSRKAPQSSRALPPREVLRKVLIHQRRKKTAIDTAENKLIDISLANIWRCRDPIAQFMRWNFIARHKPNASLTRNRRSSLPTLPRSWWTRIWPLPRGSQCRTRRPPSIL